MKHYYIIEARKGSDVAWQPCQIMGNGVACVTIFPYQISSIKEAREIIKKSREYDDLYCKDSYLDYRIVKINRQVVK